MRRLTVFVLLFGLALVFQGCKPADACDGLFGFFGGSSSGSYGGNYTPVYSGGCGSYSSYDACGSYASVKPYQAIRYYSAPVQISDGCCPETQVQVNPCDPVQKSGQIAPTPQIDLVPQEANPKMTPVDTQDGPEMLPPAILKTDGTIGLVVPAEAIVYINGYRTKKTGTTRIYQSKNLSPGLQYWYSIVVQVGSTKKVGVVKLMGGERKFYAYRQFYPPQLLANK